MQEHRDYDLICLGCGPAGEKAATQARYFGHRVAIVERCARPGGAMVNTGTVPSKVLRETALLCSAFHRRPLPGMDFMLDHKLSIAKLMAQRHMIEQQEHDRIEQSIDRHGIDVYRGQGRLCDPQTIEITAPDGSIIILHSRFLLIATGSSPVRPEHIPFDVPGVVDADGVLQLQHIPKSMIIVGGGVIGAEYASVFSELDVNVTVVHAHDEILPFVDSECRERLMRSLREQGVVFELHASVRSVTKRGRTVEVTLEDHRQLNADVLLWAAGRSSNTTGIGLEEIGVELGERGVVRVSAHYQTNVPSIYAAGDVIGFPALAATSMEQGRIAACHMFDIPFKRKLSDATPIGIYTIPAISMVGMNPAQAEAAGHEIVIGRSEYRYNVRGRMLGDERGLLKCIFDRNTHALLGASVVGEDATELIHLAQSVMTFGGGIDYFIDACFNYPSLCELFKYAAYSALQVMASDARKAA